MTVWFISDTHFGHKNIIKFEKPDGTRVRPHPQQDRPFHDISEHDELLVENWNALISPSDKVYHLGDVGNLEVMPRLNGKKRLILGNHDNDIAKLQKWFSRITPLRFWGPKDHGADFTFVITHMPVTMSGDDLPHRRVHFNVHGHIHEKIVTLPGGVPNPRYFNMCVEHHAMMAISLEDLVRSLKERMEAYKI